MSGLDEIAVGVLALSIVLLLIGLWMFMDASNATLETSVIGQFRYSIAGLGLALIGAVSGSASVWFLSR